MKIEPNELLLTTMLYYHFLIHAFEAFFAFNVLCIDGKKLKILFSKLFL